MLACLQIGFGLDWDSGYPLSAGVDLCNDPNWLGFWLKPDWDHSAKPGHKMGGSAMAPP